MALWMADYTGPIPPAALKAAGVSGVMRYLSYIQDSTAFKRITAGEYQQLRANGIEIGLNWEYDAQDWLGGASAGTAHGQEAVRQAKLFGHAAGKPIYGSADFDMGLGQWVGAGQYYAGAFRDAVHAGGYRAGVYGSWDTLGWCQAIGFDNFWQSMSMAFSSGRNVNLWPGTHIWQRRQVMIGAYVADHNDIIKSDWNGGAMTLPDPQAGELLNANRWAYALANLLPKVQIAYNDNSQALGDADVPAAQVFLDLKSALAMDTNSPLAKAILAAQAPVVSQDALNTAVKAVMSDPGWLSAFAAAVAGHFKVS